MSLLDVKRELMESSMIKSVGWDRVLIVEFNNGSVYTYPLPREYYEGFLTAESPGKYFIQHVKSATATKIQEAS